MSSGAPESGPASSGRTIDDAVEQLVRLVDIGNIQRDLQRSMLQLLSGGEGSRVGGGTDTPGRDSSVPSHTGDSVVEHLIQLIDVANLQRDLQQAMVGLLMSGGHGPIIPGRGSYAASYAGGQSERHKIGGLRGWFRGTKLFQRVRAGRAVGVGAGRALGLGRKGVAAAGKAGAVVGVVVAVVAAFAGARKAVIDWTESSLAAAKRLAEVSGSMAALTAERELMQMQRDVTRGEGTAGTANLLMRGESLRKEQENRIGIVVDNATNSILAVLNGIMAAGLRPVADAVEAIARKIGIDVDKPEPGGIAGDMRNMLAANRFLDRVGGDMMDAARRAADAAGGPRPGPAPGGAARLGRLP